MSIPNFVYPLICQWTCGFLSLFQSVSSVAQSLCDPMDCSTPVLPVHSHLPEPAQTHVHRIDDAIQPTHPVAFFFPCLQSFPASAVRIRWAKYWSFNISPSNEYSGLISFRMDWFNLLAVKGMLKSLLQHHSSKASIFQCSAFFIVQLSHPYMTTGKTIALTRWTLVGKVMFLVFNMLSRLVVAFLVNSAMNIGYKYL